MIAKIKSNLTTSYLMFVFDFADPSSAEKEDIEKQLEFKTEEIFNSQKKTDHAKKILGKESFNKAVSLYFSKFQTQDGFDSKGLGLEFSANKKVFLRHLGKDKCSYLALLLKIMDALDEPKRGLLSA